MRRSILSILIFFVSFSLQARSQRGPGDPVPNLELIQLGCTDPDHFNYQRPPVDIKILCNWKEISWAPGKPSDRTVEGHKWVSASLMTDKPLLAVAPFTVELDSETFSMPCPVMVEECSEGEMEFSVSCAEVMQMTSLDDFCTNRMEKEISLNASILNVEQTGRVMDFCAGGFRTQH